MLVVTNPERGDMMLARRDDKREHSDKSHPQTKNRDIARFKAAQKIAKYTPGHKDRPHTSHSDKH